MALRTLAAASFLLVMLPRASAGVLVVAADGSGDFTQIQAAITAAGPDDVLLVRPGSYAAFSTVMGKPLVIIADGAPGSVHVVGSNINYHNVGIGKSLVLRGLDVHGAVQMHGNLGTVRLEDCTLHGQPGGTLPFIPGGSDALEIADGPRLALLRDLIVGGTGQSVAPAGVGGAALRLYNTDATAYDVALIGGDGGDASGFSWGGDAGPALRAFDHGFARLVGGAVQGGEGGIGGCSSDELSCLPGGQGGDGLQFLTSTNSALLRDVEPLAGAGGFSWSTPGAPGTPVSASGGSVVTSPGAARHFSASSVVHVGQSVKLDFSGQPGETVLLFISTGTGYTPLPKLGGSYLLPAPGLDPSLALGTLDAQGSLVLDEPWGGAGSPGPALVAYLQPVFVGAAEGPALGPSATLVLLAPGL